MTPLKLTLQRAVCAALDETGGNVSAASRGLRVPRRTLTRWIRDWRRDHPAAPVAAAKPEPCLLLGSMRITAEAADPYKGELT
jgi:transposase-like protein